MEARSECDSARFSINFFRSTVWKHGRIILSNVDMSAHYASRTHTGNGYHTKIYIIQSKIILTMDEVAQESYTPKFQNDSVILILTLFKKTLIST